MTINRTCIILWIMLFAVGMWLAMHKPLWCDELYGQRITIEESSWGKILTGSIDNEGNNFPLYYAIQKAIMLVIQVPLPQNLKDDFQLPISSRKYNFLLYPKGQILLRLFPDALMTTAIVLLVRFFWIRQGVMVGLIALLSALTSGMVWQFWVEARPYPLWFLLVLVQALFLIEILSEPKSTSRVKNNLIVCNFLLSMTAALGFIQVIVAQTIIFLSGQRRFRYHFWAGILPVCLGLFFFSHRSHNPLYLGINPINILRLNFSLEQAAILFFYLMAFFCQQAWIDKNDGSKLSSWEGLVHLPNVLMGFCLSISILIYVSVHWPGGYNGFPVLGRHLLFLSALGVVMVPAIFGDLWVRSRKVFIWQVIFLGFFLMLLFSQSIEGFANAWFSGYYM